MEKKFCIECLDYTNSELIEDIEIFQIKNDAIEIKTQKYKCTVCGTVNSDHKQLDQYYEMAYDEYRRRHKLISPCEIQSLLDKYALSQRQLAKILGWSHVTLSRYITGALPTKSHSNGLVLIQDPKNMLVILERNQDNLKPKELDRIQQNVYNYMATDESQIGKVYEMFYSKQPSIYTGYKNINLEKILEIVKYFAYRNEVLYKVKLMKLLWYTDFVHFKRYGVSITGLTYEKLPMGPVPMEYDVLISELLKYDDDLQRQYVKFEGWDNLGERFVSLQDCDNTVFDINELKVIKDVYHMLANESSTSISDKSHMEKAWLETADREKISYEYAQDLLID